MRTLKIKFQVVGSITETLEIHPSITSTDEQIIKWLNEDLLRVGIHDGDDLVLSNPCTTPKIYGSVSNVDDDLVYDQFQKSE